MLVRPVCAHAVPFVGYVIAVFNCRHAICKKKERDARTLSSREVSRASYIASATARRSRGLEVERPRVSTHALVFALSRLGSSVSALSPPLGSRAFRHIYDTLRAFPGKNKNRRAPRGPRARRARPSERLGERS